MKSVRLFHASALAIAVAGCQAGSSRGEDAFHPSADPIVSSVIQGNTAFATDLYGRLRKRPGNLFFSPASIPEVSPDAPALFAANRVWCQAGLSLSPTFLAITKDVYGAAAAEVDFKKSSEPSRQELNRKISAVVHQAFVDVNEQGTEAAAATAVIEAEIVSLHKSPPHRVFRADHPFLRILRDRTTGSILFMGRVVDPVA